MKKIILLLVTWVSIGAIHLIPALSAQEILKGQPPQFGCTCLPQGITFTNQAQIDNFQTNYPGCTEIEGYVTIKGGNITNLNGLSVLASIGGYLTIGGAWNSNPSLTSLTGLENLTSIGGGLYIYGNNSLTSLTGLENLTSIGGYFYIDYNNSLTSLTGLENLTSIGGYLSIGGNYALTNLASLENLSSIGGDLKIIFNWSLTSLTGLDNLVYLGGDLEIEANVSLINLSGLENLTSIGGNFLIYYNDSLVNLAGLEGLTNIGGSLKIVGTGYDVSKNSLTNLTGLESLNSIGGDLVLNNLYLISLIGLDNLTSIGGVLSITSNSSLSTCDAGWLCEYLAAPTGAVNISGNASGCNSIFDVATACGGIPCLPYGNYHFRSQSDIDNFQAVFPNCTELQGDVTISGNDITDLSGLNSVTTIGGNLYIGGWDWLGWGGNPSLTSLTGLENLAYIGGSLYIENNTDLTSLFGLESLTSIGGSLIIHSNSALTRLTGIDNIAAGSITKLNIGYNLSLSSCHVQSICDYLVAPNGTVTISYNAPGCNSQAQVIAACETVGIDEVIAESGFSIYPNPFTGQLSIEFNLPQTSLVSIQIFNAMGAKVAELQHGKLPAGQQQFTWHAGDLPKGLYFCRVQAGNELATRKILKH